MLCACVCAQADFVLFTMLKTLKVHIDNPYDAGKHAISILAKNGTSLVVNHTVHKRRNDQFATELMNVYKTAIGAQLVVDAPPCRDTRAAITVKERLTIWVHRGHLG